MVTIKRKVKHDTQYDAGSTLFEYVNGGILLSSAGPIRGEDLSELVWLAVMDKMMLRVRKNG